MQNTKKRTVVAFYCSPIYGSEYKSGWQIVTEAINAGIVERVIISDIEKNINSAEWGIKYSGVDFKVVPSIIKSDRLLRKLNDLLPQWIWHYSVAMLVKVNSALWIVNGAQPWLPLKCYMNKANDIIWGPVGGSEKLNISLLEKFSVLQKLREILRSIVVNLFSASKVRSLRKYIASGRRVTILARTNSAFRFYKSNFTGAKLRLVPEIINILNHEHVIKQESESSLVNWVWVGQNIPRKNIALSLSLIDKLAQRIPGRHVVHIFGPSCLKEPFFSVSGVELKFYGWVDKVPWDLFRANAIFINTSIREGLPSTIIEAMQNALFCLSTDVGSISAVFSKSKLIKFIDMDSDVINQISDISNHIQVYLQSNRFEIDSVCLREELYEAIL